jgi:hypothetical protein
MQKYLRARFSTPAWGSRTYLRFVLLIAFILSGCTARGTPAPTQDIQSLIREGILQTQEAQTHVAGSLATDPPISQVEPTRTKAWTPTEIALPIPDILEQALMNPQIHSVETFDSWTSEDWSYVTDNISVVNDGGNILRLPGLTDWGTIAVLPAFRQDQGVLTRFKLAGSNYRIEFHLIQNDWNTPTYKRYGGVLYDANRMKTAIYEGTDDLLYNQVMDGSLVFGPDRWYGLFIGADGNGGFRFLAWDWEDPGRYVWHEFQGSKAWASGEWRLEVPVDTGTVFLDDFSIVSFDEFSTFPNAGITKTSTPPTPLTIGAPTVSVSLDTNCRTGPGEPYESISWLHVGETAQVVGRSPGGDFWIIQNIHGSGTCWLWKKYATVTGDTSNLPIIQAPTLTPTPKPHPILVCSCVHGQDPVCDGTGFPPNITGLELNACHTVPAPIGGFLFSTDSTGSFHKVIDQLVLVAVGTTVESCVGIYDDSLRVCSTTTVTSP